jgi:hypothetical protein
MPNFLWNVIRYSITNYFFCFNQCSPFGERLSQNASADSHALLFGIPYPHYCQNLEYFSQNPETTEGKTWAGVKHGGKTWTAIGFPRKIQRSSALPIAFLVTV